MFDELRELVAIARENGPKVVAEVRRAVDSIAIAAESLAAIADELRELRTAIEVARLVEHVEIESDRV